jgi:hypothetical protein
VPRSWENLTADIDGFLGYPIAEKFVEAIWQVRWSKQIPMFDLAQFGHREPAVAGDPVPLVVQHVGERWLELTSDVSDEVLLVLLIGNAIEGEATHAIPHMWAKSDRDAYLLSKLTNSSLGRRLPGLNPTSRGVPDAVLRSSRIVATQKKHPTGVGDGENSRTCPHCSFRLDHVTTLFPGHLREAAKMDQFQ